MKTSTTDTYIVTVGRDLRLFDLGKATNGVLRTHSRLAPRFLQPQLHLNS